jgi:hypothetical protein
LPVSRRIINDLGLVGKAKALEKAEYMIPALTVGGRTKSRGIVGNPDLTMRLTCG